MPDPPPAVQADPAPEDVRALVVTARSLVAESRALCEQARRLRAQADAARAGGEWAGGRGDGRPPSPHPPRRGA